MNFTSEANERIHKEELVRMKHRRSIFEKSYGREFKTLRDVDRARIPTYEREELYKLVSDIILHEIFFNSYDSPKKPSLTVCEKYGSEASLVYELYECARAAEGGFLLVFGYKNGNVNYYAGREYMQFIKRESPCLALDLEEHAYFYDYLFERDKYIKNALSELNLSKI